MILTELKRISLNNPEFDKYVFDFYNNKKEYCTGDFGADERKFIKTSKIGKLYYAMPKLKDLFVHLFNCEIDESILHDAIIDCIVCLCCFYKLRYNKIIWNENNLDNKIKMYINKLKNITNTCSGCFPIFHPIENNHMKKGGCCFIEEDKFCTFKKRTSVRLSSKAYIKYSK